MNLVLASWRQDSSKQDVIISKDTKVSVEILQGKVVIPKEKGGKNGHIRDRGGMMGIPKELTIPSAQKS